MTVFRATYALQVPVNVRDQIKNLELLGYSSNRKRPSLKEVNRNAKPQHAAKKAAAEKATAGAA